MFKRLLCLLFILQFGVFAADLNLSAKFISGKVEMQKKSTGKWLPVRVGAKFKQLDRLRTYASASAILSFDNGSEIQLQENSMMDIAELNADQGNATSLSIKRGNLLFNIKKLTAQDKFKFETSTATAAIRGTEGGIGVQGEKTLAYLDEGVLEIVPKNGGKAFRIGAKEIAVQTEAGFQVQTLNPGQGSKVFQQIMKDSTLIHSKVDSLISSLPAKTTSTVDKTSAVDSTPVVQGGKLNSYESSTFATKMNFSGECTGGASAVRVGEFQAAVQSSGSWSVDVFWPLSPVGTKKFSVFCQYGNQSLEIGQISVDYQKQVEEYQLNLSSANPQKISEGKLLVEGNYVGKDAVLRLTVGSKAFDLSSPSGQFKQEVEISDRAANWDLTKADLNLQGPSGNLSQSIEMEVDKTSKKVNTSAPDLSAKLDVQRGLLLYSLQKSAGDPTSISILVDGEERELVESRVDFQGKSFALLTGNHRYQLQGLDQAQNLKLIDLGSAEFWQKAEFSLDVSWRQSGSGVLELPPLPPQVKQSQLSDLLHLEILGLPNDDPKYIDEILVVNSALNFRKSLKGTEIKELTMDLEVPLALSKDNPIVIRVKPKVGDAKEWTATIQVRR